MKNEINLLPPKKSQRKDNQQARTLRFVSIGLLLLVTTASVGVFFMTLFSPLPGLKEQEKQVSNDLGTYQTKAVAYLVAHQRLSDIESYLKKRNKYAESLADMQSTGNDKLRFTGIKIDGKDVILMVSSNSLESLNAAMNELTRKSENEKLYSNFSLSSLDYTDETNEYAIGLNVTLH
jgi:hypothetical protein